MYTLRDLVTLLKLSPRTVFSVSHAKRKFSLRVFFIAGLMNVCEFMRLRAIQWHSYTMEGTGIK